MSLTDHQDERQQRKALAASGREFSSWGTINPSRLKAVLAHAGRSVLDAGCSSGEYVRHLTERNYDAYGIDLLANKEWHGIEANRFSVADTTRLPFASKSFDTVISFEVLEHVPDVSAALCEYSRVARSNCILTVPNCAVYRAMGRAGLAFHHYRDRTHCNFFTEELLCTELARCGFRVEKILGINSISPEYVLARCWRLPSLVASVLQRLRKALPFTQHYYMTLLVVAKVTGSGDCGGTSTAHS